MQHLVETDKSLTEEDKDALNEKILRLIDTINEQDHSKIPNSLVCPISKVRPHQRVDDLEGPSLQ